MKNILILIGFFYLSYCENLENLQNVTKLLIGTTITVDLEPLTMMAAKTQRTSFKMFQEKIESLYNSSVNIGGKAYKIEFKIYTDDGFEDSIYNNYRDMCKYDEILAAIVPMDMRMSYTADILEKCGKVAIVPVRLPEYFYEDHLSSYQIPALPPNYLSASLPHLKYANLTKVGIVAGTNIGGANFLEWSCNISDSLANRYGITIVYRGIYIEPFGFPFNDTEKTILHNVLDELMESKANVLFLCTIGESSVDIISYIKSKGYDFGAIVIDPQESPNLELMDYTIVALDYHEQLRFKDDYYLNAQEFSEHYYQIHAEESFTDSSAWYFFYAGALIYKALSSTTSLTIKDFKYALSRINLMTIVGPINYDGRNRNKLVPSLTQRYNNTRHIVWPPSLAIAEFVLPVPTWKERVYDPSHTPSEWGLIGVSIFCIVCSISLIIFVIVQRSHSVLRVSLPMFLILICIGSILMYSSIFFWVNHQVTDAACHLRIWLLSIGFCLLFAPLLSKNYQVWKMWTAPLNSTVKMTTLRLLLMVIGLLSTVIALLIIFSSISNARATIRVLDVYRPFYNQEICEYGFAGTIMVALIATYCGIMILSGLRLAWGTRNVTLLAYNESKVLLLSMYNVSFFSVMALIIILNENKMGPEPAFILRSICFIFSAFISVVILLGNKFWLIYRKKNAKSRLRKTTFASSNQSSSKLASKNSIHSSNESDNESQKQQITTTATAKKVDYITISIIEYNKLQRIYKNLKKQKEKAVNLKKTISETIQSKTVNANVTKISNE